MRALRRFRSWCLPVILCAALLTASVSVAEETTTKSSQAAERLVFLLQYVGTDYAGAVRDGAVVDESEYREMVEFSVILVEDYRKLRSLVPQGKAEALDAALARLQTLIGARANPQAVRTAAESVIPVLIDSFALRPVPKRVPAPERARSLYAENCASCHGATGRGDGSRAKELDPPPANFTDPARIENVAPYVFYNAITLGVPNTAMASFREAFADEQRWDLAFFLWTFSVPNAPVAPAITLSLRDLATRSSADLLADVIRQATATGVVLGEAEARTIIADLRARPRTLTDQQEGLARVRQDLVRSLVQLEQGDLDGAADRVTMTYLNEFEPLEAEIDRRDPSIRRRFEIDLVEFRAALRRGDRKGATAVARSLADTVESAAQVLGGGRARGGRIWFFSLLAVFFVIGALLIAIRRLPSGGGVGKLRSGG